MSSKAYYEKHYTHPEWPGGASGVTVGIGYDLGYQSSDKIEADWRGRVDGNSLLLMKRCAGVRGAAAQSLTRYVQQITVPWDAAMSVFTQRDIPQWEAATKRALPNCDLLSATCFGVLVSISYNRGAAGWTSAGSDRFREMYAIRQCMLSKRFALVADQIDSMARLWPNSGVGGRRHREASLFRDSLAEPVITSNHIDAPLQPAVIASNVPDKTARTPPPATTKTQNAAAGAAAGATIGAASYLHSSGVSPWIIAVAIILGLAAGGGGWWLWYKHRNPTPRPASD